MFYMSGIKSRISDLATSVAAEYGVSVVDVELAGSARRTVVRVFLDKAGGVTLEDCANFSRALSALLDVEDFIKTAYVLEVSSPGLDRPLRSMEDFAMNKGKLARVVVREQIGGQNFVIGRISDAGGNTVRLVVEHSKEVIIPFDQISKARLEIEIK
ncbi:MAG: ribosome maturation factor RimP [Nitrospirae bacterium]|nr:ribosome maturation factor RimP [Nitrospirota bacterium]